MAAHIPQRVSEDSWRRFVEFRLSRLEQQQLNADANDYVRAVQERIKRMVAKYFGIGKMMLDAKSNLQSIVYPRQIAMYLMYATEGMSYPQVGRAFGGRHHTTVIHAVEKIHNLRQVDKTLDRMLKDFSADIAKFSVEGEQDGERENA